MTTVTCSGNGTPYRHVRASPVAGFEVRAVFGRDVAQGRATAPNAPTVTGRASTAGPYALPARASGPARVVRPRNVFDLTGPRQDVLQQRVRGTT